MSNVNKHNLPPEIKRVVGGIEKAAEEGKAGNFEIRKQGITVSDVGKMTEGKRYIDEKNKRLCFRVGKKIFYQDLTELT